MAVNLETLLYKEVEAGVFAFSAAGKNLKLSELWRQMKVAAGLIPVDTVEFGKEQVVVVIGDKATAAKWWRRAWEAAWHGYNQIRDAFNVVKNPAQVIESVPNATAQKLAEISEQARDVRQRPKAKIAEAFSKATHDSPGTQASHVDNGFAPHGGSPADDGFAPHGGSPADDGFAPHRGSPADDGFAPHGGSPADDFLDGGGSDGGGWDG